MLCIMLNLSYQKEVVDLEEEPIKPTLVLRLEKFTFVKRIAENPGKSKS